MLFENVEKQKERQVPSIPLQLVRPFLQAHWTYQEAVLPLLLLFMLQQNGADLLNGGCQNCLHSSHS